MRTPLTSRAVVVGDLRKSYGAVEAVRGVSFTVEHGEIFALLGPNGAGKSTTLEILEGFRTRDAGRAEVLGLDPGDRAGGRELRERIGLVRISFALPDGCATADLPIAAMAGDDLVTVETGEPTETLHRLTDWALRRGTVLDRLTVERPSLEDVYLRLTGHGAPAMERSTR